MDSALRRKASVVPGITVTGSSCLGQCGNGSMVLVLPDIVWYSHVYPSQVPLVVEQHLLGGEKVKHMLYRRFHPRRKTPALVKNALPLRKDEHTSEENLIFETCNI